MKDEQDAISWVRESRRRISAQFGHNPKTLVEYYIELQQQYKDRWVSTDRPKKQKEKAA